MSRKAGYLAVLVLALSVAIPLSAQGFGEKPDYGGGCAQSPENPTLILAGLASGAFAVSSFRTRLRARRASQSADKLTK
jgi:XrtJ-associated TM-motif-TM protein